MENICRLKINCCRNLISVAIILPPCRTTFFFQCCQSCLNRGRWFWSIAGMPGFRLLPDCRLIDPHCDMPHLVMSLLFCLCNIMSRGAGFWHSCPLRRSQESGILFPNSRAYFKMCWDLPTRNESIYLKDRSSWKSLVLQMDISTDERAMSLVTQ